VPAKAVRFTTRALAAGPDWCAVHPDRSQWLRSLGLTTARDFLNLPGVVVSGHVGRNVSRVSIGATTAYLKCEHRVRLRDRFRSWRDGFGWASMSEHEAVVLRRLADATLPGPQWLAYGEADGEAFLLIEGMTGAVELRSFPSMDEELPVRLGRAVARVHAAGIDQPDLFAKHILVRPDTGEFVFLDWQRATLRSAVRWRNRLRTLAALRATADETVLPADRWDRLLSAYLSEAGLGLAGRPSVADFAVEVARLAAVIAKRPGIRAQRIRRTSEITQELIRIDGETVCAIPAVAPALDDPAAIALLYDPRRHGATVRVAGRAGVLRIGQYRWSFGRWLAGVRGKAWRAPELRAARMLFHLQRNGIGAPALLAYGQQAPSLSAARAFLLSEPVAAQAPRPGNPADRDAVQRLLSQVHDAGCVLRALDADGRPFGIADGVAVVVDVSQLRLVRRPSPSRLRRDITRLDAFFRGAP
jgi:Lipopolysaccharide kinase (Kdo/WaaP) family